MTTFEEGGLPLHIRSWGTTQFCSQPERNHNARYICVWWCLLEADQAGGFVIDQTFFFRRQTNVEPQGLRCFFLILSVRYCRDIEEF